MCTRCATHDTHVLSAARAFSAPRHCNVVRAVGAKQGRASAQVADVYNGKSEVQLYLRKKNLRFSKIALGHVPTARQSERTCTASRTSSVSPCSLQYDTGRGCRTRVRHGQVADLQFGKIEVQLFLRKMVCIFFQHWSRLLAHSDTRTAYAYCKSHGFYRRPHVL